MKLCKLLKYENDQEKKMIFVVVEDNGDRCVISPANCFETIVPTELVRKSDIQIIGETKVD